MAEVVYLGHSCVRLRGRDGIVLIDPFDRSVGLDIGKPSAHIVLISHDAADHNNLEVVKPMRDDLFVADGPGEYEVQSILIRGIGSSHHSEEGQPQGLNTIYVVHLDDIAFCHLGDLGHKLTASQVDEIGEVDVVFAPVGNGNWALKLDVLDDVIGELEPKLLIPMYNNQQMMTNHLQGLDVFTTHKGMKEWEEQDKFTVSKSSLPREDEELKIVILQPNSSAV